MLNKESDLGLKLSNFRIISDKRYVLNDLRGIF